MIKLLLAYPSTKVNPKNSKGHTPLHLAIKNSFVTVTKLLLAHPKTDINCYTDNQEHPLDLAIRHSGCTAIIKQLLEHPNIDVPVHNQRIRQQQGQKEYERLGLIDLAIQANAVTFDLLAKRLPNNAYHSLIPAALQKEKIHIIKSLLASPSIIKEMEEQSNSSNQTRRNILNEILECAIILDNQKIIAMLLAHSPLLLQDKEINIIRETGFNPYLLPIIDDLEQGNWLRYYRNNNIGTITTLNLVLEKGNLEIAKRLIQTPRVQPMPTSTTMRQPKQNISSLGIAIRKGYLEIVKLLLEQPNVNVHESFYDLGKARANALAYALELEKFDMIALFFANPFIRIPTSVLATILPKTVEKGYTELVKNILKDTRIDDTTINQSIQIARSNGNTEIAQLLVGYPNNNTTSSTTDSNTTTPSFNFGVYNK